MVQSTDPGRRSSKKRRGSKLSARAELDRADPGRRQAGEMDWQQAAAGNSGPEAEDDYPRSPLVCGNG
jgi:hypothetical protein